MFLGKKYQIRREKRSQHCLLNVDRIRRRPFTVTYLKFSNLYLRTKGNLGLLHQNKCNLINRIGQAENGT